MTQNEGQNFGSSSRALGAFDQRGPYGILIHLGVDFVKMNESQFRAENPAAKYPLPYSQLLLSIFKQCDICLCVPSCLLLYQEALEEQLREGRLYTPTSKSSKLLTKKLPYKFYFTCYSKRTKNE